MYEWHAHCLEWAWNRRWQHAHAKPWACHLLFSGPAGELNPDLLVAGQASSRWTSRPILFKGSVREPEPLLLPYQGSVRPQHLQTKSSGSGSRTRPVELMRLDWALAHPQCQSQQ